MERLNNNLFKIFLQSAFGAMIIFVCTLLAFKLPGSTIPQTAQTFGVLVVAALLGPRVGFLSVVFYLMIGILGIPVFASGTVGPEAFMGPTFGYLIGFIFAALLCGWWCSQSQKRAYLSIVSIMLLAHILILTMGWMWLSSKIGPSEAFVQGVYPFFYGALFKSLIAASVVVLYYRFGSAIKK